MSDGTRAVDWNIRTGGYVGELQGPYHRDRIATCAALIPAGLFNQGTRVIDFGCGDGGWLQAFLSAGCDATGIDVAAPMIEIARQRLVEAGLNRESVLCEDVNALRRFDGNSVDAMLAFNVLAYLSPDDELTFYREAHRILKPSGSLILTHSNILFDLFSLNSYTVRFFQKHLTATAYSGSVRTLLTHPDEPSGTKALPLNVRENPLAYRLKLQAFGFEEVQQEFMNLHPAPPALLSGVEREYPSTLQIVAEDRWKLNFVCSVFGSRSRKI